MTLKTGAKVNLNSLSEDLLKKYIRTIDKEDFLFHQDDLGNTMFIIVSGSIDLLESRNGQQFLMGTLGAGQVLGEKAMLTEGQYRRSYAARASDSTTLLEFSNKNLKLVEQIIPNFTTRILHIAAKRLDRANRTITLLRSMDPSERILNTVRFLAEENGTKTPEGIEFPLSAEDIHNVCAVELEMIRDSLESLVQNRILIQKGNLYVLVDSHALEQFLPDLRERLAA